MLKIDSNTCLFNDITHYRSDNCNERPHGIIIDTIIIHCISLPLGAYGNSNIVDLFTNNLDIKKDASFASLKNKLQSIAANRSEQLPKNLDYEGVPIIA